MYNWRQEPTITSLLALKFNQPIDPAHITLKFTRAMARATRRRLHRLGAPQISDLEDALRVLIRESSGNTSYWTRSVEITLDGSASNALRVYRELMGVRPSGRGSKRTSEALLERAAYVARYISFIPKGKLYRKEIDELWVNSHWVVRDRKLYTPGSLFGYPSRRGLLGDIYFVQLDYGESSVLIPERLTRPGTPLELLAAVGRL
jgi:hypothetical protein